MSTGKNFLFNDTLMKNNRKKIEKKKNDAREREKERMRLFLLLLAKCDFPFIVCIFLSHINMIIYA